MFLIVNDVLDDTDMREIREDIARLPTEDGRSTAGWSARAVKSNRQATDGAPSRAVRERIAARLMANPVFALAVRPKHLSPLLLARYGPGETYGAHVDDAVMAGMRTDVSFTVFLADPDAYDGGELVIETSLGDEAIKLPAGAAFVYPSTTLHRVAPVTRGERIVAVGWARSLVRSAEKREILFDIETARRAIHAREGATREFDLLSKACANLLRLWAED